MALDVGVQLYYDGGWHDLVDDYEVFAGTPITIIQGVAGEGSALRPAGATFQLDNATDKYRPTNPTGVLYGKVGRNTPTRIQVGSSTRAVLELTSVSLDQTRDFRRTPMRGRRWADVQGGGLLERVNSWSKRIRSAFTRYNSRISTLSGYWPCEDATGAKTLESVVPGGLTQNVRGLEYQSQTRPAGTAPLLVKSGNGNGTPGVVFPAADPLFNGGWQFSFLINFGDLGGTGNFLSFVSWSTWNGTTYSLTWLDGDDLVLLANAGDGTVLINQAAGTIVDAADVSNWADWQLFVIKCTESAGTVTISIEWATEGSAGTAGPYTKTFSGITSSLRNCFMTYSGTTDGFAFGHILGTTGTSENLLSASRRSALNAHVGERASSRFARLCTEEGIPYYVGPAWAKSTPLGPQAADTFANLFKEIADTDDALIYDTREETKIQYISRADRYRQAVDLTLTPADFPANGSGSLPREAFDNDGKFNLVRVSQRDGGEYTTEDATGPLGSAPPPAGIGEKRQDFDITVAVEEVDLPQAANWWLRRGTVDLPRFPQLTLDLAARPSLVALVDPLVVGDVIEITGFRENTIRLHILGWTEVIGWPNARRITFNCASDQQFVVGKWDATDNRYDLRTCTLNGSHNSSTGTLTLKMTADEAWSTAGVPYDFFIAGERVTVTAMGARSGSLGNYAQTATVTRSINGVAKTLPSGSEVHIATPGRWAL